MSNSIQVVDNFLPDEIFYPFASVCMRHQSYVPRDYSAFEKEADGSIDRFGEDLTPVDQKSFAEIILQCVLYARFATDITVHDIYLYYPLFFRKLEEYLNVKRWILMRINCTMGQPKPYVGAYHVDFDEKNLDIHDQTTTSIFYLNTNNGGTQFKDDKFVQSKKNRLVTFPTNTYHAGVWSTDAKLRYVLNMTYETK